MTLLAEYQDASKRFRNINKRIVKLVTPPNDFLFNGKLRDQLLFENNNYTYSRRYFWAFQALALLNDEIQAMISAYKDTFTDDVWTGEHKYIWPGTAETSSRYSNFRRKLVHVRKQFEKEISELQNVLEMNEREQKDIKSLRDQLFSGTSVLESREAVMQARITVMQGYNIRLLTLVSIFFLPLTFVTSVFGMTNMPPKGKYPLVFVFGDILLIKSTGSFRPFGIVTAAICVPTYFLIVSVNSPDAATSAWKRVGWLLALVLSGFRPHSKRVRDYERKNKMGDFRVPSNEGGESRSFATRTLSSYEKTEAHPPPFVDPRRPSRAYLHNEKPPERRPSPVRARTREMVQFDLPDYHGGPTKSGSRTLEKTLSDPGPNGEAGDVRPTQSRLLRTFSDRFGGSPSPRSSGMLV